MLIAFLLHFSKCWMCYFVLVLLFIIYPKLNSVWDFVAVVWYNNFCWMAISYFRAKNIECQFFSRPFAFVDDLRGSVRWLYSVNFRRSNNSFVAKGLKKGFFLFINSRMPLEHLLEFQIYRGYQWSQRLCPMTLFCQVSTEYWFIFCLLRVQNINYFFWLVVCP